MSVDNFIVKPIEGQSQQSTSVKCTSSTTLILSPTPTSKKGLENYVGFANLPNQVFRKSVKKGFQFTLMVVGESGLGKSTLINSLFLTDIYTSAAYEEAASKFGKTMSVNASTFELKEGGVRLQLTVVDTPGFGDNIDNTDCWNSVIQNIEAKFEDYLNAESRVNRTAVQDTRVHCCLYFIAPTGHGLKPLDIEFMKKLHSKVNIVPVIAKADTLTADECYKFKQQILKEIEDNQINIYRFPPLSDDESENDLQSLRRIPFAVVGSNTVLEVGGKKIRGRKYPWGIVEVENIEHCDFIALRNLLIRTHMQDLIDVTNDVHYENFRSERLSVLTGGGSSITSAALNINPMDQIEREKEDQEKKLKKMEQEMEQVFEMKVKEKKKKLKDSEAEFNRKFEVTMRTLQQSRKELEERRKKFDAEREQFDSQYHPKDLDNSRSSSRSSLKKSFSRKNRPPDLSKSSSTIHETDSPSSHGKSKSESKSKSPTPPSTITKLLMIPSMMLPIALPSSVDDCSSNHQTINPSKQPEVDPQPGQETKEHFVPSDDISSVVSEGFSDSIQIIHEDVTPVNTSSLSVTKADDTSESSRPSVLSVKEVHDVDDKAESSKPAVTNVKITSNVVSPKPVMISLKSPSKDLEVLEFSKPAIDQVTNLKNVSVTTAKNVSVTTAKNVSVTTAKNDSSVKPVQDPPSEALDKNVDVPLSKDLDKKSLSNTPSIPTLSEDLDKKSLSNTPSIHSLDDLISDLSQGLVQANTDIMDSDIETPTRQLGQKDKDFTVRPLSKPVQEVRPIVQEKKDTVESPSLHVGAPQHDFPIPVNDEIKTVIDLSRKNSKARKLSKQNSKESNKVKKGGLFCKKRPGEKDKKKQKKFF